MAKMQVLESLYGFSIQGHSKVSDGMASYFDRHQEKKTLNVTAGSFVPRAPAITADRMHLKFNLPTQLHQWFRTAGIHMNMFHYLFQAMENRTMYSQSWKSKMKSLDC